MPRTGAAGRPARLSAAGPPRKRSRARLLSSPSGRAQTRAQTARGSQLSCACPPPGRYFPRAVLQAVAPSSPVDAAPPRARVDTRSRFWWARLYHRLQTRARWERVLFVRRRGRAWLWKARSAIAERATNAACVGRLQRNVHHPGGNDCGCSSKQRRWLRHRYPRYFNPSTETRSFGVQTTGRPG